MLYFSHDQSEQFLSAVTEQHMAVDVVGRKLGGLVLSCSDEWFAEAKNLVEPKAPIRDATRFVHAGAWYDGWETRRHNTAEYDWVILQMGVAAAHIVGCEVDTAFFNGNHAPAISVEALYAENHGIESGEILENDPRWKEVIPSKECGPSQRQFMLRDQATTEKYTHIKLKMFPDGGIARFRLYGRVVPPADLQAGSISGSPIDLASACNGGVALKVSDQHFGSADNLLLPGRGHDMSDGWETKRSRSPGHVDWAIIQLGKRTTKLTSVVVDTAHFRGNFPQYITVHGLDNSGSNEPPKHDDPRWFTLVDKSKTGPDLEHTFDLDNVASATHVKLTIIPDGGVKRIRVFGY
ncbi:LAME_0A04456g1_1 [Lachancea meyersii CBS 8951]|uniref:allantoicase n=1 Tax=Lachancea meyersii CBS 8951 TaxID=1266667 RepID=A0A1G4IP52_9SACH|nr:LAME_0A04456g1_1 [Lachancea meyersii CBS 8951]